MVTKPKKRQAVAGKAVAGKNLGGRPFVADADRRDTLVRVLTNASEYAELQGAAGYAGMPLSTWLRVVALERARAVAAEKEAARNRDEQ
jgi:hypothetical protein